MAPSFAVNVAEERRCLSPPAYPPRFAWTILRCLGLASAALPPPSSTAPRPLECRQAPGRGSEEEAGAGPWAGAGDAAGGCGGTVSSSRHWGAFDDVRFEARPCSALLAGAELRVRIQRGRGEAGGRPFFSDSGLLLSSPRRPRQSKHPWNAIALRAVSWGVGLRTRWLWMPYGGER